MLKIIHRWSPATLQHQFSWNTLLKINPDSFKDRNRYSGHKNNLSLVEKRKRGHSVSFRGINLTRNVNSTFCSFNKGLFHHRIQFCLPQRRNASFQSSIESFAQTQTGIFKFLSESTPVEYCQNLLLSIHEISGLSWWGTIICCTIISRTVVTLPLAVYQQYILAKLENLKLELPDLVKALKKETAIAVKMYGWDEKMARIAYNRSMRKQWNNLIIRDNCHPFKSSILLWFQIPMWISLSVSLRNFVYMLPNQDLQAQLTFAEFALGGFSFIPNLTLPDESWIFPIALGIVNLLIIEVQQLSKSPTTPTTKLQKYLTNIFRVISVLMIPIAATVPSCLALYWTTSSTYGLVQNVFLMSPRVKRIFRIPATTTEIKHPYKMVVSNLQSKLKIS